MATLESVAKELAENILSNRMSKDLFTYVRSKIDSLTYTETGKSISNDDKLKILDMLEFKLEFGPDKNEGDVVLLTESQKSTVFRDLVATIKKGYKNGK
jgi:hypothetical protein